MKSRAQQERDLGDAPLRGQVGPLLFLAGLTGPVLAPRGHLGRAAPVPLPLPEAPAPIP